MGDTIDDLHCAEDAIGELAGALRRLLDVATGLLSTDVDDEYEEAALNAARVLVDVDNYCRPSCCFLDEGECLDGDDCGCPCGHEGWEER